MTIRDLKPSLIWEIFDDITKVPRPSKQEEQMRAFLVDFAKKHNVEYKTDEIGNVAMFRPAAPGYENAPAVVLQGHMDMVCEKNGDVEHDFLKDPIQTYIDGEWVRAKGTTLGADNGIGVAAGLAAMIDPDLKCGAIEALITVDEETGLTGANNLGEGMIKGDILLNLDSEEDGDITIGCAGGFDTTALFTYAPVAAPADYKFFKVLLTKFQGGHSGTDINVGRYTATKAIARILYTLNKETEVVLASINAGNLRNAIAREAEVVVGVKDAEAFSASINRTFAAIANEYKITEPTAEMLVESVDAPATVIDAETAGKLVNALYSCIHGVVSMSVDIPGLVETSTNLASVKMQENNGILVSTSQRSSVESRKFDIAAQIEAHFASAGAKVAHGDGYPGWAPDTNSHVLKVALDAYEDLFGNRPTFGALHAGLECGLFLTNYPSLDMISFGPTLHNVHSPKEEMHIPAVEKFWVFLHRILADIAAGK